MNIKELRDKQKRLITEARAALDEIKDDTPEARAKELEARHDTIMAEHDTIDERIKREERLAAAEAGIEQRNKARRPGVEDAEGNGDGRVNFDAKEIFTRAMRFGVSELSPEERNVMMGMRSDIDMSKVPAEIRALAAGTAAAGGYTVPQGFSDEIEKAMKAYGPMYDDTVTRVLRTDTGNDIPWPQMDDTVNVGALLAENTATAEQDIAFTSLTMKAYMYTSKLIRVPYQLLQDSAFNVESEIINPAFGERIGRIANQHLTTGTGAGAQPNGIVTASTLGKTTAAVAAVTSDEVIDFYHSVDPAYRSDPSFKFMFNDSSLQAVRKLKDSQNRYLIDGLKDNGAVLNLAGISVPYVINQDMAAMATGNKFMLAGAFNRYVVRRVKEMQILRLAERYAEYFQVGFVGFARFDGNLINSSAVKHMKNA